jgi:signal transduction histidine kinase
LRGRLFAWFGVVIVLSGTVAGAIIWTTSDAPSWREEMMRWREFTGRRFGEMWDEPERRDALAHAISTELGAKVTLTDASGARVESFGGECTEGHFTADVVKDGTLLGEVRICPDRDHKPHGASFLFGLLGAGAVLWMAAGFLARRLTRPIDLIVNAARDIGDGKLDSRMKLGRHHTSDLRELAETFNHMAARIQKQLTDQKELLAAVSHEIRTPLGHMRILLDLARDSDMDPKVVAELEKEVLEVDSLVDQLLASSRLEFESLEPLELDAADLARRALTRLDLDESLLDAPEDDEANLTLEADPMLLGRALANLLDNAREHGGGVTRLEVRADPDGITFAVEDDGPGLPSEEIDRVFDSFYRGDNRAGAHHGSLGLGLSLVRRIAKAHEGRAFADNREGGGARVGITIPRQPPIEASEKS